MRGKGAVTAKRDVSGVLLLDKPAGLSSNAALQAVKRLYRARKAGHTGTLDPMATGLLPTCLGEASKFSGRLLDAEKGYRATLRLGERTDTGDREGRVLAAYPVDVSEALAVQVLGRFHGKLEQVPPMYSALKRDGRPLYAYARAGVEVARAARPIVIHQLDLLRFEPPWMEVEVVCSKGTYVRVLAEDIGAALGCGAHLAALRRTQVGEFRLEGALTLEALADMSEQDRDGRLLPMDCLLEAYPAIRVSSADAGMLENGRCVRHSGAALGAVRIYGSGRFIGLGEAEADGTLRPRRLVRQSAGCSAIAD
jgi:tRNA pseudouridine55 synthase